MTRRGEARVTAPGVVLVVFIGVWLGHTLEYARLRGVAGLHDELLSSVHVYMLPLGALLATLASLNGVWCWRAWQALGRQLDATRASLARIWRADPGTWIPAPSASPLSSGAGWLSLAVILAVLQTGVYTVQENLENAIAGRAISGLGVVTGVHWLAPVVHLTVAVSLAALLSVGARLLRDRRRRLERCERLVQVLFRGLLRRGDVQRRAWQWLASPLDRFGRDLWSRPPPRLLRSH